MRVKLSDNDKLVLRFVTKKKMWRNWIRDNIWFKGKGRLSKNQVEYSLRKLAKNNLIKSEKWDQVHRRVYWK